MKLSEFFNQMADKAERLEATNKELLDALERFIERDAHLELMYGKSFYADEVSNARFVIRKADKMTKHTPLPWKKVETGIFDNNGKAIASVYISDEQSANAHFIVTACNCHADLLEACKLTAAIVIDKYDACDEALNEAWNASVEAIRKAEQMR